MQIRPIAPDEYARLGALTVDAYIALEGHVPEPEYEEELADVRTRAESPGTEVLVAVDEEGHVLGGVTYLADDQSPFAEYDLSDAAAIRMLAVDRAQQRFGTGEALVRACITKARDAGRTKLVLHSTPWMTAAHSLYFKLGFVRDESLDWYANPAVKLLGFRLEL